MKKWVTVAGAVLLVMAGGFSLITRRVPHSLVLRQVATDGRTAAPPPALAPRRLDMPPAQPLKLVPVNGLTAAPRPGGGWTVASTPEAVAGLPANMQDGPAGLFWVADQQALFRWRRNEAFDLVLMDLKTGELNRITGYTDITGISPNGRYPILKEAVSQASVVVDMAARQSILRLPAQTGETWLNARLLWAGNLVVDVQTGQAHELPDPVARVAAVGGDVCYATKPKENAQWATVVACVTPEGSGTRTLLTGAENRNALYEFLMLTADPSGRRLAFGYRSSGARLGAGLRMVGVAEATPPIPPVLQADTLAVYDSADGSIRRFRLPGEYYVVMAAWSANGAYLGLAMAPGTPRSKSVFMNTDLWVLETATGRLQRVYEHQSDKAVAILSVRPDGSLLTRSSGSSGYTVTAHAYGKEPALVPGGERLLPNPPWEGEHYPGPAAVLDGDTLNIYGADGLMHAWNWPADLPQAYVSADPENVWAAVQQVNTANKSGLLVFLHK